MDQIDFTVYSIAKLQWIKLNFFKFIVGIIAKCGLEINIIKHKQNTSLYSQNLIKFNAD